MDGDIQIEGPDNRRNALLIGGIATVVVIIIAIGVVMIIRNRRAAEEASGTPQTGAPAAAVPATNAAAAVSPGQPPAPMSASDILKKIIADRNAHPSPPQTIAGVELNVEKTMTADQKKQYGFSPAVEIKYKWVVAQDGGSPFMLITNPPPEPVDSDHDGLSDDEETSVYHTDPHNPDTDGDGITDGDEVHVYHTDPLKPNPRPPKTKK